MGPVRNLSKGLSIGHAVAGQLRIDIPLKLIFLRDKLFQFFFAVEFKLSRFFLTADFFILLNGDFGTLDRLDGEFFTGVQSAEDFAVADFNIVLMILIIHCQTPYQNMEFLR
jgi:hypothetical protein